MGWTGQVDDPSNRAQLTQDHRLKCPGICSGLKTRPPLVAPPSRLVDGGRNLRLRGAHAHINNFSQQRTTISIAHPIGFKLLYCF